MPVSGYKLYIYSNDGTTVLQDLSAVYGVPFEIVETGINMGGLDDKYIYSGDKKFIGVSTSPNATTPTYAIGDSFLIESSDMTVYIVEGELETKPSILIKNPITIFNKVEEISGTPIEISSLDSALLVKENEGKIYKSDGKLYRVVADKENAHLVSLLGATVRVPSGWSASSGFGRFNIQCYTANREYFSINIGYTYNPGDGFFTNSNTVTFYHNYNDVSITYNNTSLFEFSVLGGTDVTNQSLIQWFVDNNATIEGGEYVAGYIFQEILSPSGTLDVTANGEVDVKSYEKINVSVPEVPVWDGTVEDYVSVNLIEFTIGKIIYQAEEGMTWAEWCNSTYNTGSFVAHAPYETGTVSSAYYGWVKNGSSFVRGADLIVENNSYTVSTTGTGGGSD